MTDPGAFDALSASTATISAHLSHLPCVARWTAARGVPPAEADRYVRSMFSGVALAMSDQDATLEGLAAAHETPHGHGPSLTTPSFVGGLRRGTSVPQRGVSTQNSLPSGSAMTTQLTSP